MCDFLSTFPENFQIIKQKSKKKSKKNSKRIFLTPLKGELIPAVKWNNYYDYPSLPAIRHLIFKNKRGFRDKVVKYSGRRILLCVESFYAWIAEQNQGS